MPITKTVKGNLITLAEEGNFGAIVQGCNCFCVMGAGLAPQIAKRWPPAEEADNDTKSGDLSKLGKYSLARDNDLNLFVINGYTQGGTGGRRKGQPDINYKAVSDLFTRINNLYKSTKPLGIPLIGAGLAGGHWEAIQVIIDLVTPDIDITLVEYEAEAE